MQIANTYTYLGINYRDREVISKVTENKTLITNQSTLMHENTNYPTSTNHLNCSDKTVAKVQKKATSRPKATENSTKTTFPITQ